MQVSTETRPSPVVMIVGIIGGALLAIGSFLTWATVSLDLDAFVSKIATALNLDPTEIRSQLPPLDFTQTVSGMKGGRDGVLTLVAGILVVVFAIVVFVKADLSKVMGALMLVAGAAGAGIALWDLGKLNDAKEAALGDFAATPDFQALQSIGFDAQSFSDVVKVTAGIGIYLCALGGIVAIVAGVMALARKAPTASAPTMGAPMGATQAGTGFETTQSMPTMPATPAETGAVEPPAPTVEATPTESTPEPPASPEGGTST